MVGLFNISINKCILTNEHILKFNENTEEVINELNEDYEEKDKMRTLYKGLAKVITKLL